MGSTTPTELRAESFKGAEGLAKPLNNMLVDLQRRLSLLEARQEVALLEPRIVSLPIDVTSSPESAVSFALPVGFTPTKVFLVSLELSDSPLATTIQPTAFEYVIDTGQVRVQRLTTTSSTLYRYRLTLGVFRAT